MGPFGRLQREFLTPLLNQILEQPKQPDQNFGFQDVNLKHLPHPMGKKRYQVLSMCDWWQSGNPKSLPRGGQPGSVWAFPRLCGVTPSDLRLLNNFQRYFMIYSDDILLTLLTS